MSCTSSEIETPCQPSKWTISTDAPPPHDKQMKMPAIKLRKAYSKYGANDGRPSFLPNDSSVVVKLRLMRMRLDSGGYDAGGAYWGVRTPPHKIYWAESVEEFRLGMYDRPPVGTIEMTVDATSRAEAKNKIRELLPNAKFYR